MSIRDYKDPIVSQWHISNGNKYSKIINNEPHIVVSGMFALIGLPDIQQRVIIDGYLEVGERDEIKETNQFKVDYTNGYVFMHLSQEGKSINVTKYASRGVNFYPASRVWTKLNENGSIEETLQDITDQIDGALDLSNQVQQAENIRIQNEDTRIDNESNRVVVENQRAIDEQNRENAEMVRISNEENRITKEQERLQSEITRVQNELSRISNEGERILLKSQLETLKIQLEDLRDNLTEGNFGDMFKIVYDTNNNGKVDIAENAEKLEGKTLAEIYADIPEGITVTDSTTNGNILVNNQELQVYDDSDVVNEIGVLNTNVGQLQNEVKTHKAENVQQITNINSELESKVSKIEGRGLSTNDYTNTDKTEVGKVAYKADKTYVDTQISAVASGSPKGVYSTLAALQSAYPTGNVNIYVVTEDGKWYYWNGTTWTAGGVYQSTGVTDNSITTKKVNFLNPTFNLFNPRTITVGKQINQTTAEITDSTAHSISDFIEVKPNTTYYVSHTCAIRRYAENGTYISGTANISDTTFTTTATTKKIRLQILNTQIYQLRLIEGDTDLGFAEHGYMPTTENTQAQLKNKSENEEKKNDSFSKENIAPFSKIDLLKESIISNIGCAISNDYTVKWRNKKKSIKINTVQSIPTVTFTLGTSLDLTGISEFIALIYIDDITKITNITLDISGTSWVRHPVSSLKQGWNVLRFQTSAGDISNWSIATSLRCTFYTNEKTTIYISDLLAIRPSKAKILFINDHGYHNFKEVAYPQLKALGIPTTWAINPGRLGVNITETESILTQADIDELAYDAFSEFSFHNWNPINNSTATMTSDELIDDTHKCITYLKKNGIMPRYPWRAAFTNNLAPQHESIQHIVEAYATPSESGGIEIYPFRNRYNINRVAIHGSSVNETYYDNLFDTLKKTRGVLVCYTHGLDDSGGIHLTTAQLNYFLSKIQTGVLEGWLEGTTYSKLRAQYNNRDVVFDDVVDVL